VPDPNGGTQRQIRTPIRYADDVPAPKHVGCEPGAHRDEILAALGYSPAEIGALADRGVFGT
jgi:alpha-methylacyl-CoA racemase